MTVGLGGLGAWVSIWPQTDAAIRWYAFVAFLLLTGALLLVDAVADHQAKKEQVARDARVAALLRQQAETRREQREMRGEMAEARADLAAVARRDAKRDHSLRAQAILLAAELEQFLSESSGMRRNLTHH
ncbi:MAG: hypothetical protein ABIP58_08180 [Dehalococcoidia bacterium]